MGSRFCVRCIYAAREAFPLEGSDRTPAEDRAAQRFISNPVDSVRSDADEPSPSREEIADERSDAPYDAGNYCE